MFGRIKRQLTKGDKYFQENCRKRRLATQTLSKWTVLWLPTRYQSFKFRYQHQRRRRRRRRQRRGWTQSGKLRVLSEIVAPQRDISRRQQIWPWPFNIFFKTLTWGFTTSSYRTQSLSPLSPLNATGRAHTHSPSPISLSLSSYSLSLSLFLLNLNGVLPDAKAEDKSDPTL